MKLEDVACMGYDIMAWFIMFVSALLVHNQAIVYNGMVSVIFCGLEIVDLYFCFHIYLHFRKKITQCQKLGFALF